MLTVLFYKFKNWIIGFGAIALAILSVYAKGRSDGKNKAITDDREELRKDVQFKKSIKDDVANDTNSQLDERLRYWIKD